MEIRCFANMHRFFRTYFTFNSFFSYENFFVDGFGRWKHEFIETSSKAPHLIKPTSNQSVLLQECAFLFVDFPIEYEWGNSDQF